MGLSLGPPTSGVGGFRQDAVVLGRQPAAGEAGIGVSGMPRLGAIAGQGFCHSVPGELCCNGSKGIAT